MELVSDRTDLIHLYQHMQRGVKFSETKNYLQIMSNIQFIRNLQLPPSKTGI